MTYANQTEFYQSAIVKVDSSKAIDKEKLRNWATRLVAIPIGWRTSRDS